jgi:hypothetical protein
MTAKNEFVLLYIADPPPNNLLLNVSNPDANSFVGFLSS